MVVRKKLLVIGGTGFVGHHLLKTVQKKGWDTTSISLNKPSKLRFVEGINYFQLNICDKEKVKRFFTNQKFQFVVNLGGYIDHTTFKEEGQRVIDHHFIGLLNVIDCLNRDQLECFVQIGSSDEYGNAPSPQSEESREQPISPYSAAKVAATHFLQMLHRTEDFPVTILRLFLTYGPCQDTNRFLPQIITECLKNRKFPTSSGIQIRDFCNVKDIVEAILIALQHKKAVGEVFNAASGQPISIKSIIEQVNTLIGTGTPQLGIIPFRSGENMKLFANSNKIKEILDWQPKINLWTGLRDTIEWYKNQN